MFRPQKRNALSRVISFNIPTDSICTCYKEVKKEVTGSYDSKNVSIENGDGNLKSFMRFLFRYSLTIQRLHDSC